MSPRTIEQVWESFASAVLSGVPRGGVQWIETRRAFYAGAFGLLCEFKAFDPTTMDEGVLQLQDWEHELVAFGDKVNAGRA